MLVLLLHFLDLNDDLLLELDLPVELILELLDVSVFFRDDVIFEHFLHLLIDLCIRIIGLATIHVLLSELNLFLEVLEKLMVLVQSFGLPSWMVELASGGRGECLHR